MEVLDFNVCYQAGSFSLEGILKIHRPQLVYLSGENGSGKSTLLKLIAGHLHPNNGHLRVGTQLLLDTARCINIKPEYRGISWQSQEDSLFPLASVKKNITWWQRHAQGIEFAKKLGVEDHLDRLPSQLSGGQRALCLLARTLATPNRYILLDEPLASLDDLKHDLALKVIQAEAQKGRTILMVVHHPKRYNSVVELPRANFKIELG